MSVLLTDEKIAPMAMPSGFCRAVLGMELHDKQAEIMDALELPGAQVTAACCNESGKTSRIIAGLILWHVALMGQVVSTAGVWRQVIGQLGPALKRYRAKFPAWRFNETDITVDGVKKWVGFSTNEPGRFEGYHGSMEEPLLIIVDEAKSVQDEIFHAIEKCNPQRLLLASSTGVASGEFFNSHSSKARFFKRFKLTVDDCPHIEASSVQRRIEKWGQEHPLIRSMFYSEFIADSKDTVLSLADVDNCLNDPPRHVTGDKVGFCDFAAGGDENVLAVRDGNKVEIVKAWKEANTMAALGEFILQFQMHDLQANQIFGDNGGMGKVMISRLAEAGWPITPVNANGRAYDQHYMNRSAEMWHESAEQIKRKQVILPYDEEMRAQLVGRKRCVDSRGKLGVEPKDQMKKRGLDSPDRADAVVGALCCMPISFEEPCKSITEVYEELEHQGQEHFAGAMAE